MKIDPELQAAAEDLERTAAGLWETRCVRCKQKSRAAAARVMAWSMRLSRYQFAALGCVVLLPLGALWLGARKTGPGAGGLGPGERQLPRQQLQEFSTRLPVELIERLRKASAETGKSQQALVREALEKELK